MPFTEKRICRCGQASCWHGVSRGGALQWHAVLPTAPTLNWHLPSTALRTRHPRLPSSTHHSRASPAAIMLSHLKRPIHEVRRAVFCLDETSLKSEDVKDLLRFLPSEHEVINHPAVCSLQMRTRCPRAHVSSLSADACNRRLPWRPNRYHQVRIAKILQSAINNLGS